MSPPPPPLIYEAFNLGDAVERREPTLISDVMPASISVASWTPTRLASLVTSLDPVHIGFHTKVHEDDTHEFWIPAAAEGAHEHGFLLPKQADETTEAAMSIEQFWQPTSNASTRAVHSYSGSLFDDDGRATLPDLQTGLDELVAALGGDKRDASHNVWLGTTGATTPLHYDTRHTVHAQLYGTKDFWVFPPRTTRRSVRLYPSVHPLSHFQRSFGAGVGEGMWASDIRKWTHDRGISHSDRKRGSRCLDGSYNLHAGEGECVLRYRLSEGEVMYVPPFWLHRATCSDACISTNAWVASQPTRLMEEMEATPRPFEYGWPLPTRYAAVLAFLRAMLRHVHAAEERLSQAHKENCKARAGEPPPPPGYHNNRYAERARPPAEVVANLLSTRWHQPEGSLFRAAAAERSIAHEAAATAMCEPRAGDDNTSHDHGDGKDAVEAPDMAKIDLFARRYAEILANAESPKNMLQFPHLSWRGPKLILLHDQLERFAHWATGGDARATHALLHRLISCCSEREQHDEL